MTLDSGEREKENQKMEQQRAVEKRIDKEQHSINMLFVVFSIIYGCVKRFLMSSLGS